MSKPDGIPVDVWQSACVAWMAANVRTIPAADSPIDPIEFVARAILSERSKAAKIAEDEADRIDRLVQDVPNNEHRAVLSAQRLTAATIGRRIIKGETE